MQVLHFVAWRKVGMQVVYDAFMQKGIEGAYKVRSQFTQCDASFAAAAAAAACKPADLQGSRHRLLLQLQAPWQGSIPRALACEQVYATLPHEEKGYSNSSWLEAAAQV